jgi:hypothetical protein
MIELINIVKSCYYKQSQNMLLYKRELKKWIKHTLYALLFIVKILTKQFLMKLARNFSNVFFLYLTLKKYTMT